jgi:hypothetical protein
VGSDRPGAPQSRLTLGTETPVTAWTRGSQDQPFDASFGEIVTHDAGQIPLESAFNADLKNVEGLPGFATPTETVVPKLAVSPARAVADHPENFDAFTVTEAEVDLAASVDTRAATVEETDAALARIAGIPVADFAGSAQAGPTTARSGGVAGDELARLPMSDDSLKQLARTVRELLSSGANETLSGGELPALDCVALIAAFTKALYPGDAQLRSRRLGSLHAGVALGRAVDDSMIGTGRDGGRLARGARWKRVGSWQTVIEEVEAKGVGASALVLWQRQKDTGHAFAAHRTTVGVRWLEIGASDGRQVLGSAPVHNVAHARYVVIDATGRVVDAGPPEPLESDSVGRAIVDAPLFNDYGKMGPEFETDWELFSAEELDHGDRLFGNRELELVAERLHKAAPTILEFVGGPINMPGEMGGIDEDEFWGSFEYAFRRLKQFTALSGLFGRTDNFRALDYPDASLGAVAPGKELALSPQWTVGMPASEMLDWLLEDVRGLSVRSIDTAHADAEAGAALGKLVAARYLAVREGMNMRNPHVAWELLDDPDYRSVGGMVMLVFMQAVTAAHDDDASSSGKELLENRWFKNYTFAASRHDPAVLSRALSPAARNFLESTADSLIADFSSHALLTLSDGFARDPVDVGLEEDQLTVGDYVNSFLKDRPEHTVTQHTLAISTTYDRLDGDKVLVELRDLPDVHDVPEARAQYEVLKKAVQPRYARAARRLALSAGEHARQRSLFAAIDADPRVGILERLLSVTSRFNVIHPEKEHGFVLLERAAVRDLAHAVVRVVAPQWMSSRPTPGEHLEVALNRLGERLVGFGMALNLSGDPSWDRIKLAWNQSMHDVASLRTMLTGAPANWPPQDVTAVWKRFSAVPGLSSRKTLLDIDRAVSEALVRPGEETALQSVLDEINTWRIGLRSGSDSSAAQRARAVDHLERVVLHKLATVAAPVPYSIPDPKLISRWGEKLPPSLDQPRQAALVSQGSNIVDDYPFGPQATRELFAREAASEATRHDAGHLVASPSGREQASLSPERRTPQVAVELALHLGPDLPTAEDLWSRYADSPPLHDVAGNATVSVSDVRDQGLVGATSQGQASAAAGAVAPWMPEPEEGLHTAEGPGAGEEAQGTPEGTRRRPRPRPVYARPTNARGGQVADPTIATSGQPIAFDPADVAMLPAYPRIRAEAAAPAARSADELRALVDGLLLDDVTTAATGAADNISLIERVSALSKLLPLLHPATGAGRISPRNRRHALSLEQALVPGPGWHDVSDYPSLAALAEAHGHGTTVLILAQRLDHALALHHSSDGILVIDPLVPAPAARVRLASTDTDSIAGGRFIVIGPDGTTVPNPASSEQERLPSDPEQTLTDFDTVETDRAPTSMRAAPRQPVSSSGDQWHPPAAPAGPRTTRSARPALPVPPIPAAAAPLTRSQPTEADTGGISSATEQPVAVPSAPAHELDDAYGPAQASAGAPLMHPVGPRPRGARRGAGDVTVFMAHTDQATVNGLHAALVEAIDGGNEHAAAELRRMLDSRQKAAGFDESAQLGRSRRQADPQAASEPPGGTAQKARPLFKTDRNDIPWASSTHSASEYCVEVTVIPQWAADWRSRGTPEP